jgi:UDP-3-O-[3-hydroxymyristoyl] glucosamine N-acyltransferase
MKQFQQKIKPKQIASKLDGTLIIENKKTILSNVAELAEANENSVCFFENETYLEQAKLSNAGLIFVPQDFDDSLLPNKNLLKIEQPYVKFMMLVSFWLTLEKDKNAGKIHKSATIAKSAKIGKKVTIGANVVIGDDVQVGANSVIEANTVIKEKTIIGESCHFYPNVSVYQDCIIGDRVILHSGCVIGADGFGFLYHEGKQHKIPQVGIVELGNDVEIGANSAIDRATLGVTKIEDGTKVDNLVQVGHNCKIGKNSMLCSQVGLAGSTIVGNLVYLAGQVGVGGHLTIHDRAKIGAQSGVMNTVEPDAQLWGTPAIPANDQKRLLIAQKQYSKIHKNVKKLVKDFEQKSSE